MSQNFLKIKQVNTFYQVLGDQEKAQIGLLILHGWNQFGSQSWLDVGQSLSENGFLVVLPDMPCFGKSDAADSVWGVKDYATWLDEFYQQIQAKFENIQYWFIVGHSFGGGVSALWVSQNNNVTKVKGLVLAAPAIVRKKPILKQKIIIKITKLSKNFVDLIPFPIFKKLFQKVWYRILGSNDYQKTSGVKREIMQKILREDLQFCLAKIQLKTLILWGTKDTYTPFTDSKLVISKIANSEIEVFEGINHGLHLNARQKVVQKVSQFVNQ